jgi:hypothetical protein
MGSAHGKAAEEGEVRRAVAALVLQGEERRATEEEEQRRVADAAKAAVAAREAALVELAKTLAGKDGSRRLRVLEDALRSGDAVAQAIALDAALSGDDRLLREAAIKLAFEHRDRGARQRVVRDWPRGAKSLGGTMKQTNGRGGGDAPEVAAFSLSIREASSNGDTINFTAALTGGVFEQNAREDPMIGSFLGTQLSIGNAHCSIVADLQPDQTFLGILTCDNFMNSCDGCRREGTA